MVYFKVKICLGEIQVLFLSNLFRYIFPNIIVFKPIHFYGLKYLSNLILAVYKRKMNNIIYAEIDK